MHPALTDKAHEAEAYFRGAAAHDFAISRHDGYIYPSPAYRLQMKNTRGIETTLLYPSAARSRRLTRTAFACALWAKRKSLPNCRSWYFLPFSLFLILCEKEREHQQAQADSKKQEYEDKIRQDEKDLQDKIDEANKNQNSGGKVNESDFGDHDVDFDNNHSDKDGNLDDSVKDITTDPSGDKTDEPLPDPNSDYESSNASTNETSQNIYEYEEPYTQMSKEEIAEAIVEQMATPSEDISAKVYTYHV